MVASDLRLGGFSGAWGDESAEVKKKRRLLEEEGVRFDAAGRVRDECVHHGGSVTVAVPLPAAAPGPPQATHAEAARLQRPGKRKDH